MKKLFCSLIICFLIVYFSSSKNNIFMFKTYAIGYKISNEDASELIDKNTIGLEVTGKIPIITNHTNKSFENNVNSTIRNIAKITINSVQKNNKYVRSINFSSEEKGYGDKISLVINSAITSSTTKNEKHTITFNPKTNKILDLNDILGANGVKIANNVIRNKIASNPNNYTFNFQGVAKTQSFYLTDNNVLVVLYNQQEFEIDVNKIKNFYINSDDFFKKETYDLMMVKLRPVCEAFGYNVSWNGLTNAIDVSKKSFKSSIYLNKNKYTKGSSFEKSLEGAPTLRNSITYVPISFFEEFLGINYYISDKNITFSYYEY